MHSRWLNCSRSVFKFSTVQQEEAINSPLLLSISQGIHQHRHIALLIYSSQFLDCLDLSGRGKKSTIASLIGLVGISNTQHLAVFLLSVRTALKMISNVEQVTTEGAKEGQTIGRLRSKCGSPKSPSCIHERSLRGEAAMELLWPSRDGGRRQKPTHEVSPPPLSIHYC